MGIVEDYLAALGMEEPVEAEHMTYFAPAVFDDDHILYWGA